MSHGGSARPGFAGRMVRSSSRRRKDTARRALVSLELVTGATGLAGGLLLAVAPDGSLLRADPATLADSPFSDWRVPGALLAGLVGGGFLLAARWQWSGHRYARELSVEGILDGLKRCMDDQDRMESLAAAGVRRIRDLFSVERRRAELDKFIRELT